MNPEAIAGKPTFSCLASIGYGKDGQTRGNTPPLYNYRFSDFSGRFWTRQSVRFVENSPTGIQFSPPPSLIVDNTTGPAPIMPLENRGHAFQPIWFPGPEEAP
jgi:hypothetical protein